MGGVSDHGSDTWAAPSSPQWRAGGEHPWQEGGGGVAQTTALSSASCGSHRFQPDAVREHTEHIPEAAACAVFRRKPSGGSAFHSPFVLSPRPPQSCTSQAGRLSYACRDCERVSPKAHSASEQSETLWGRTGLHAENPKTLRSLCHEVPGPRRWPCPPSLPVPWTLVSCRSRHTCSRVSSFRHLQKHAEGEGRRVVRGQRPTHSLSPEIRVVGQDC